MITREQAISESLSEIHFGTCTNKESVTKFRRNGRTITWKTRPEDFKVPIKNGLYKYGYLTRDNAAMFHLAKDCPLGRISSVFLTQDRLQELKGRIYSIHEISREQLLLNDGNSLILVRVLSKGQMSLSYERIIS